MKIRLSADDVVKMYGECALRLCDQEGVILWVELKYYRYRKNFDDLAKFANGRLCVMGGRTQRVVSKTVSIINSKLEIDL